MTMRNLDARLNPHGQTVLSVFRVFFGLMFMMHGTQKLFGWPEATPMPIPVGSFPAWWAGLIEFVCGLLIAIGLFTRPAAFLASGTMAFAYFYAHWPPLGPGGDGKVASFWPLVNGGESAVMYCFAFLLLVFIGPGAWAVDTMLGRRRVVTGTAAPAATDRTGLRGRFRR